VWTARLAGVALVALAAQTVAAAALARRDLRRDERRSLGANLVLIALIWLVASKGAEGTTLITFGKGHGLTSSDLVALLPLGLAAWIVREELRRTLRWWTSR
jgi:hypothetical protein